MIDIKLIREDPQRFKKAAADKIFKVDIDKLVQIDETLRTHKHQLQDITTEKNAVGKSIPKLADNEKKSALDKPKLERPVYNSTFQKFWAWLHNEHDKYD